MVICAVEHTIYLVQVLLDEFLADDGVKDFLASAETFEVRKSHNSSDGRQLFKYIYIYILARWLPFDRIFLSQVQSLIPSRTASAFSGTNWTNYSELLWVNIFGSK